MRRWARRCVYVGLWLAACGGRVERGLEDPAVSEPGPASGGGPATPTKPIGGMTQHLAGAPSRGGTDRGSPPVGSVGGAQAGEPTVELGGSSGEASVADAGETSMSRAGAGGGDDGSCSSVACKRACLRLQRLFAAFSVKTRRCEPDDPNACLAAVGPSSLSCDCLAPYNVDLNGFALRDQWRQLGCGPASECVCPSTDIPVCEDYICRYKNEP
jgi:hypothetical protein